MTTPAAPFGSPLDQHVQPGVLEYDWVVQNYQTPYLCPLEPQIDYTSSSDEFPLTPTEWLVSFGVANGLFSFTIGSPPAPYPYNPVMSVRRTMRSIHGWKSLDSVMDGTAPHLFADKEGNASLSIAWVYDFHPAQGSDLTESRNRVAILSSKTDNGDFTLGWITGTLQFTFLDMSAGQSPNRRWSWGSTTDGPVCDQSTFVNGFPGRMFLKEIPLPVDADPDTPHDYIAYFAGQPNVDFSTISGAGHIAIPQLTQSNLAICTISGGTFSGATQVFGPDTFNDYGMIGCEWDSSGFLHLFGLKVTWSTAGSDGVITGYTVVHRTWHPISGLGTIEEFNPPPNTLDWIGLPVSGHLTKWPVWDGNQFIIPYHGGFPDKTGSDLCFMIGNTGAWSFDKTSLGDAFGLLRFPDGTTLSRTQPKACFTCCVTKTGVDKDNKDIIELFSVFGLTIIDDPASPTSSTDSSEDHLFWSRKDSKTGKWDPPKRFMYLQEDTVFNQDVGAWAVQGGYTSNSNDLGWGDPKSKFVFVATWGMDDFWPADGPPNIDSSQPQSGPAFASIVAVATYEIDTTGTTVTPTKAAHNVFY